MNPFEAHEIWPPGTVVDRKYIVRSTLGRGGFGTVYLVNHRVLDQHYVIKRLHSQFAENKQFIDRFVKEAQAVAKLKGCPQVVEVFDMTQTEDSQLILVMEYMPGGDLAGLIERHGRINVWDALSYARQIGWALRAAHTAGLVHRDVKPSNVLLGVDPKIAKLTDFGIVTERDSARTTSIVRSGSEGFSAPEQWELAGKYMDGRTDLYALGVTMYLMLSGDMPYPQRDLHDWLTAVRTGPPPSLRGLGVQIPEELDALVIQLLETERSKRPADANAVITRIEDCLARWPNSESGPKPNPQPPKRVDTVRESPLKIPSQQQQYQYPQLLAQPQPQPKPTRRGWWVALLAGGAGAGGAAWWFTRPPAPSPVEIPSPAVELVREISGHLGPVRIARFSSDGERILTAGADSTAGIWDAVTGKLIAKMTGHDAPLYAANYSPNGQHVVTASGDSTARIWDASTGHSLFTLKGHTDRVYDAAYSPDGLQIATVSLDTTVRLWSALNGRLLYTMVGHTNPVYKAQFSPDGLRVVTTALKTQTVRVWDATTGSLIKRLENGGVAREAKFSPDGQKIVTAGEDKIVRTWNTSTLELIGTLEGHTGIVTSAEFSSDSRRIVSAGYDKTARLWNAAKRSAIYEMAGHDALIVKARFSYNSQRIVTASYDKTAVVWNTATGLVIARLLGHTSELWDASFSPDGQHVLTTALHGSPRVWKLRHV
ncbi:MAG TPA: protein kinase [Bryobacteraceae bacterium]|jgi:WD40 repeat protein/serine/threonine protein kinase